MVLATLRSTLSCCAAGTQLVPASPHTLRQILVQFFDSRSAPEKPKALFYIMILLLVQLLLIRIIEYPDSFTRWSSNMFGKTLFSALLLAASAAPLATDLSLEPCINGDVSRSGNFPSQEMERQIHAYLNWRSYEPYYLFAVAAEYLESPFEETDPRPGLPLDWPQ
jgi:hypothetical protein